MGITFLDTFHFQKYYKFQHSQETNYNRNLKKKEEQEQDQEEKMKNVMVIIDESNSSYDLLIWVLENLKDTIESSKFFIFAKQPQNSFTPTTSLSSSVGYAQISFPFSSNAELIRLAQEKNKKIALGILDKAKKICLNHGIKAETLTDIGDHKNIIRKIIQEQKIDLLVMSDQQTRTLKRCLNDTNCSLLVARSGLRKD